MPGTPTTKYSIATLAAADLVKNGPTAINGSLTTIDGLLAPSDQGLFTARPTSTAGSPGKIGRTYKSTDGNGGESVPRFFRDNGTGWDEIPFAAQQAWQNAAMGATFFGLNLRYMKDTLGFVHFQPGLLSNGGGAVASNTVLANIPAGYRPLQDSYFPMAQGSMASGPAIVLIATNGDVSNYGSTWPASYYSFGAVCYRTT